MPPTLPKGIRRDGNRYRAYVYANGQQREKRYKLDTPLTTIKTWLGETRVALKKLAPDKSEPGTFGADITTYLGQVAAMPTVGQRTAHLEAWANALDSTRPRSSITSAEIRAVLQAWRQTLSPATCNKRRTALMHLWSVLDGKGAQNPVRDVPKFRVQDAVPRGKDPHTLDAQLKTAPRCRSRAVCRVILWTGMRPVELNAAELGDLSLTRKMVVVRTAKGGRARVVPLTKQAVSAWKEFDKSKAWHRVPQYAPLNRWIKKYCGPIRVYDLRHSYGTALARRQTRLDVIGALMGHSTLELTKRYTLAAVTPDALAATRRLSGKDSGS